MPSALSHVARARRLLLAGLLTTSLAWLAAPAPAARAATITVNTTDDEVNSDGDCSLREAIRAANTDGPVDACLAGSGADSIVLPAGLYRLTIPGAGEDAGLSGDLDTIGSLFILGAGAANTIVDANGLDRALHVHGPAAVEIVGVTFQGGSAGGVSVSASSLTMVRSRVRNNATNAGLSVSGGGAALTLSQSRVEGNTAGGIFVTLGASAVIRDSTISGNSSLNNGAGLYSFGTLTVVNSTLSGNSTAASGGGLSSAGTADLRSVTITANIADSDSNGTGSGGGLHNLPGAALTLRNTVVGDNVNDCSGELASAGYNLIENVIGCTVTGDLTGNLTGVSPGLGPLQNNGGSTNTHALQAGSPAIDAGNPAGCLDHNAAPLGVDQRGFARANRCDMGAYEFDSPGTPTPSSTPTASSTAAASNTPTVTPLSTATATAAPSSTGTATPAATHTPTSTPAQSGGYRVYLPSVVR